MFKFIKDKIIPKNLKEITEFPQEIVRAYLMIILLQAITLMILIIPNFKFLIMIATLIFGFYLIRDPNDNTST